MHCSFVRRLLEILITLKIREYGVLGCNTSVVWGESNSSEGSDQQHTTTSFRVEEYAKETCRIRWQVHGVLARH